MREGYRNGAQLSQRTWSGNPTEAVALRKLPEPLDLS
jgi:hypothetical protein